MNGGRVYRMFATGGKEAVGGMTTKDPETPRPRWLYFFNVPAIDAAVDRVTKGGGQITMPQMEVPGGQWIIVAKDPQGAAFGLVAPKR
jgi:predicted enzyme related to lactoylglutathione lyase